MSEESVPPVAPNPSEALGRLESLMSVLLPPTEKISDVLGHEYEVQTTASAARQFKLNRLLKSALSNDQTLANLLAIGATDIKGIGAVVSSAATSPEVIRTLSEAFAILHPETLASAKQACPPSDEEDVKLLGLAANLFSLEDLVRAIVPFGLRQIKGLVQSLIPLMRASQSIQK